MRDPAPWPSAPDCEISTGNRSPVERRPHSAAAGLEAGLAVVAGPDLGKEQGCRPSERRVSRTAEHPLGGRIEERNHAGAIEREDRVLRRGDDGTEPGLRFREPPLHVHLLEHASNRLRYVVEVLARLRHEVSDAGPQGTNCRAGVTETGHENDRDVPALFAEVTVEAQAIKLTGQTVIEEDEGDRFGGEFVAGGRGIFGRDDAIAGALETPALQCDDTGVIFDDQDRFYSARHRT